MRRGVLAGCLLLLAVIIAGCGTMTIKHEVAPIYATVDVNIRIQQQLEEVFDYERDRSPDAK